MSVTKCILFVFILLYWLICINTFYFCDISLTISFFVVTLV